MNTIFYSSTQMVNTKNIVTLPSKQINLYHALPWYNHKIDYNYIIKQQAVYYQIYKLCFLFCIFC